MIQDLARPRRAALLLALALPCIIAALRPASGGAVASTMRSAEPDTIGLIGTARASGARGFVRITSTPTPFTFSVTADGNLLLDLEFVVEGLLDPRPLGGDTYVAWVASPQLDTYERLGPLENHARVTGRTSLNKWLAIVTVENGIGGDRPAGSIVAHGLSPSGRLQSFQGHELFNGPKIGSAGTVQGRIVAQDIVDESPLTLRFTLADGSTAIRRAAR